MKVLFIVNTDGALYTFRKPIIKELVALGHEVVSITSESNYFEWLTKLGVKTIALDFSRHSVSPAQNFRLLRRLCGLTKQQRPDIVHNFTHKPAIYGTIAARLAKVPRIFITITGLGTLFVRDDMATKLLRWLLLLQYKFALRFASTVFFQNPDDMQYFVSRKIVDPKKAVLTSGSGLDLEEFPYPSLDDVKESKRKLAIELGVDLSSRTVILFPARGVREKGFFEFYEAARCLNELQRDCYVFIHLGLIDVASSGQIEKDGVYRHAMICGVRYLGFKENIIDYMTAADVVVLPSYREGTPRSLLEALGLGKAIVTTDAPGCRETVIDGWNGYLCKVGDAQSVVSKILAVDASFLEKARSRSRNYCESKYDSKKLVSVTLSHYFKLA